jgi:phytanoyl-CoA hydroxylase
MTKEICNGWKCDRTIASVVLSSEIHAIAAQLHGWGSSRIAQDDIISKPHSGGTAVQYHRDGTYISDQFFPQQDNSITVWLPLDDVTLESGTIEYLAGSHRWTIDQSKVSTSSFHSASNVESCHRSSFLSSLRPSLGSQLEEEPTFHFVEIPRGGVVFHHQNTFHGSGVNHTAAQMRRALVIHTLRGDTAFSPTRAPSYIYGRYHLKGQQLSAPQELNESFFPVCWSSGGEEAPRHRSKWLDSHCEDLSVEELLSL